MEFSDHTSRMTHDPTTVTAPDQSFINIHHPFIHLSILTHPERVESIIKLIGVYRYLHQSFGLLTTNIEVEVGMEVVVGVGG